MRDDTSRRRLQAAVGVFAVAASLAAPSALSQEPPAPRRETFNLYGVTGLIDTPTARLQPDGQLSFTTGYFGGFLRNTLNFQALPRVEGTFHYSVLADFFGPGGDLFDRSFDVKVLISDETRLAPAIAVGLQDFLGTGVYSGEYVVASKALRPNLTVSGGVGWGRFAGVNGISNPVGDLFPSFDTREEVGGNRTGEVRFGQFLSGPEIGLFGGLEWRPEAVDGLTLKAEYADDDYGRERRNNDFSPEIPFNFGAEYQATEFVRLGAYAMYGAEFGLRATFSFDPGRAAMPVDDQPAPPALRPRPPVGGPPPELGRVVERITRGPAPGSDARVQDMTLDRVTEGARWVSARLDAGAGSDCPVEAALDIDAELGVVDGVTFRDASGAPLCSVVLRPEGRRYVEARRRQVQAWDTGWHAAPGRVAELKRAVGEALAAERVELRRMELEPRRAHVVIANPTYNAAPQAIGRTAVAMANALPPSVEDLEITLAERSLPAVTIAMRRARLEGLVERPDETRRSWLAADLRNAAPPPGAPLPRMGPEHPSFSWFLVPGLPVSLFDPDQPLRADLRLRAGASVALADGLSVSASARTHLLGTLDDISRQSDSVIPRVRSDFAEYLKQGDPGLERLTADYLFKLTPTAYGRVSAGLLESMFGGVSGEVLWKPATRDWGLGAELSYARQRDFDMRFGFRDYDVVTGHASLYWDTGWHDMEVQVDAGRYLAGDWGGTFSMSRRFDNGWELGGFFTLTDVPFDEFGEGSFDKGLKLTIPFRWGLPFETRERFTTVIRPLTRDGGARLGAPNRLYPIVREADRRDLRKDWGNFLR